jgi:hypothetical protein
MNAYAGSRYTAGGFGRGFEEVMDTVAAEVRQAVAYVDRVIVPEVRRESAVGARTVARWLDRMADKLDPASNPDQGSAL